MTGKQVIDLHKAWVARCKSIDDAAEFNGATEVIGGKRIEMARTKTEPHKVIGLFEIQRRSQKSFQLIRDKVYDVPIDPDRLDTIARAIYTTLAIQLCIPVALAVLAAPPVIHGRN